MEETHDGKDKSGSHKNEEAAGIVKKGNVQYGGSSSSTAQAAPSSEVKSADTTADEVQTGHQEGRASRTS